MAVEVKLRNCQLAFRCKQNWDEMTLTRPDGTVRFCLDCMTEVFFCKTDHDLIEHIKHNHCIAFERIVKDQRFTLLGIPIVRRGSK
jgi:hypothetical protein